MSGYNLACLCALYYPVYSFELFAQINSQDETPTLQTSYFLNVDLYVAPDTATQLYPLFVVQAYFKLGTIPGIHSVVYDFFK